MKNFKKTLALVLAFVLTIVASVGATIAWLTAEADPKTNVFTVGNVSIKLEEEVGVVGDGAEVTPVEEDDVITGHKYEGAMPGDKLIKKPTVTNTGNKPAYVAITVTVNNANLINAAIDDVYEGDKNDEQLAKTQSVYDDVFEGWGINYNPRPGAAGVNDARGVIDGTYGLPENVLKVDFSKTTDFDNDTTMFGIDNWFKSEAEQAAAGYSAWLPGGGYYTSKLVDDETTEADERDYTIVYTYYAYLEPTESVTVFDGLNVPTDFNADQLAMFDGLTITVGAKAIQADNMPTAQYAFMVLNGDELPPVVSTTEDLKAAMKTNNSEIILEGGTYDMGGSFSVAQGVTIIGSENDPVVLKGTLTSTLNNVTFKNVTFESGNSSRWAYAKGNVVFENCTFNATSVYAIHYDGTSGADILYKNCDIIGWVAIAGGQNSLTFDGCTISGNGAYGVIRVYGDTTIKNCTFDVANVNTTDVYQDGIHAVDCTVTVKNCTNVNGDVEDLFNVSGTGEIVVE